MTNDQVQQRQENLQALVDLGIEPYPYRFTVTHHAADLHRDFDPLQSEETTVTLAGRVMTIRGHGKSTFANLQDKTGRIQLYLKLDILGQDSYRVVRLLDLGDVVGVEGRLFRTRTGEATVRVETLTFLSKCLTPLPEKWHGLKDAEIRYRQRYLDLLVNEESRRVFEIRAAVVRSLRKSLDSRGFLEVDTPVLQPIYGGAFARPFVTHHEALNMELYLRISNELYLKRLIVGGMERVYEIARDFRNEGIDRTHNPEFSMLEFYQAYADYDEMMTVTEELVSQAILDATGGYRVTFADHAINFTPPWSRQSYFGALSEAIGVNLLGADEAKIRKTASRLDIDLKGKVGKGQAIDEIFSQTVEPNLIQPTFITDFPQELSPLAKKHREDDRMVERFELFLSGMELANAFSEQNDPYAQEEAFRLQMSLREQGDIEAQVTDEDYLRAMRLGMPPTGGVGIGVDRLVMVATGAANIREVILFPQLRREVRDSKPEATEASASDETADTQA